MSAAVDRLPVDHRASHSLRCLSAAGLVGLTVIGTVVALSRNAGAEFVAAVDAVLAVAAAVLLHAEVVSLRRGRARDRAEVAAAAATQARLRVAEHISLVELLAERLRAAQARSDSLDAQVVDLTALVDQMDGELELLRETLGVREGAHRAVRARIA